MTVPELSQAVHVADKATAYVAHTQVFYNGDDFVEVSVVPEADLAPCKEPRFVPPGGKWHEAAGMLRNQAALIMTGERGIGRRTAALHLLNGVRSGESLYELVPTWKRPSTRILPLLPGARCLLDMSEPTEKPPPDDFGERLLNWASEQGIIMVVIATDETGAARWAYSARTAAIRLQSPDARSLAARELRLTAAAEARAGILDDPSFREIWLSAPKAADTRRLVKLIAEEPFRDPKEIIDEYQGWRQWIERTLSENSIGSRTLMWAAAFCSGGKRGSVLRMSENLRRRLEENRTPAAILSDAPASRRLIEAGIISKGDRVQLDPSHHGIAKALRVYLWQEFEDPPLRDLLTNWLVSQLVELPADDAERLAQGILEIVVVFRDDDLLRALRDKLTGDKQPVAARLLSRAAVDPQFGAHVRSSLYSWVKDSRSWADLVAAVCGGEFGRQQPGMAMVRLGWAAQSAGPESQVLASALAAISDLDLEVVLENIAKWFDDKNRMSAGVNSFLALASTSAGAARLSEWADPATGRFGFRDRLIDWFQRSALESDTSYQATISVFQNWEKFSADGTIDPRIAIPVVGRSIEPTLGKNPMRQLYPAFPDTDNFWSQVFAIAIRGTASETDSPTVAPDPPMQHDPDETDLVYSTPEPATASAEASSWPGLQVDAPRIPHQPQAIFPDADTNASLETGIRTDTGTDANA